MARATEETRAFQGSYDAVFNAVCWAAQTNGWTIVRADPSAGFVYVSAGMSALSWGEDADIRVAPTGSDAVTVAVRFKLKFGLVDPRAGSPIHASGTRAGTGTARCGRSTSPTTAPPESTPSEHATVLHCVHEVG